MMFEFSSPTHVLVLKTIKKTLIIDLAKLQFSKQEHLQTFWSTWFLRIVMKDNPLHPDDAVGIWESVIHCEWSKVEEKSSFVRLLS